VCGACRCVSGGEFKSRLSLLRCRRSHPGEPRRRHPSGRGPASVTRRSIGGSGRANSLNGLMIEIKGLTAPEGRQHLAALADILLDCVEGGASVSFMAPLSSAAAQSFLEETLQRHSRGRKRRKAVTATGMEQIYWTASEQRAVRKLSASLLVRLRCRREPDALCLGCADSANQNAK
jgi:hypothetical protein